DRFGAFGNDARGRALTYPGAVAEWLGAIDDERGPDDLLGVVVFDGGQIAVATPRSGPLGGASIDFNAGAGTDIGGALRFAEALFPPDARKRLVLVSDGNDTTGSLSREIERLAPGSATSVPVDVVPVVYSVDNEVLVEGVDAPPRVQPGAPVTVRVLLTSTGRTSGRLAMLYNDEQIDINGSEPGSSRSVELTSGRNVVPVTVRLSDARVHTFEPVFTPDNPDDDGVVANNRGEAFTVTPGRGKVGVVTELGAGTEPQLVRTLRAAGLEAEAVPPGQLPTDLLGLYTYDLIVLDNVARSDMTELVERNLVGYVRDLGGGLVMAGGDRSFGAGSWNGSDLEEILPLELDLPEDIITPSAAIAFVIDTSGSMQQNVLGGSRTQQQIANESTALAIRSLDPTDLVTVIAFDSNYYLSIPLSRNRDPEANAAIVRNFFPGGGTNMYPAIRAAGEQLRNADANVKHVIVLSDGATQDRSPMMDTQIGEELRRAGITVSTIGIGDNLQEASESLRLIAQAGGGTYYPVVDPNALPRIFLKEIMVVRTPSVRVGTFPIATVGDASVLTTGLPADAPPIFGINITQRKDDPLITYSMATSIDGEPTPLLAHWNVGQGRVAAFASGTQGEWVERWLRPVWHGYAGMWTRIARTIARPAGGSGYELTTEIVGDELVIRLDAYEASGEPVDLLTVTGRVYAPDGSDESVRLSQIGPGSYETRARAPEQGNYTVSLAPTMGGEPRAVVIGGVTRAVGPELANLRSDVDTMQRIAERTGGRRLRLDSPDARTLFDRADVQPSRASTPLWPVLAAWALVVFVLDVGTRRIAWDRLVTREVIEHVREQTATAVRTRSERAAGVVSGLRETTKRAERAQATPRERAPMRHRPMDEAKRDHAKGKEGGGDASEALARAKKAQDERRQALRAKM
ncbi:MAG: VWA domain-containing protein, partial [Planctomycetota bacterium]